ncbi:MAG: acetyl-CoA acetyltransferase [Candidatus Lokiarchaeota archaeon]|nr:acetyl-CoA acetyltransferase [Candidatus Lokiarchaeota archaeon]MBD3339152.1 acetyl-CoA acetyltransferase [Candidatus Lokiarchaeota archaeon]
MNKVAIVGVGHTKFGRLESQGLLDLLSEASLKAIKDSNTDSSDFDSVYVGNMSSSVYNNITGLASAFVDKIGLIPAAADHVRNGPASGGSALKAGFQAIASGMDDLVLVVGGEKMTHIDIPGFITSNVATITHPQAERPHGVSLPSFAGLLTRAYLEKYNAKLEWISDIAIKNHNNGALNPYAHFQRTIESFMESAIKKGKGSWDNVHNFLKDDKTNPIIADPLRLFHICPISDGSAALVLTNADRAKKYNDTPILISGVGQATDTHIIFEREEMTTLKALNICSKKAYDMAKKSPQDIDVAELHDAFEILEAVESEDIGFFKKGEGAKAAHEGETQIGGKIPLNPSGGLKARGHPLGATGIAQVAELVWQLRGEAGKRQVNGANTGITCNFGGFGNNILSFLVERM